MSHSKWSDIKRKKGVPEGHDGADGLRAQLDEWELRAWERIERDPDFPESMKAREAGAAETHAADREPEDPPATEVAAPLGPTETLAAFVQHHEAEVAILNAEAELGRAWAEAEAALPEGWVFYWVSYVPHDGHPDGPWSAAAGRDDQPVNEMAYGPTPAAALRALAAKLRELAS